MNDAITPASAQVPITVDDLRQKVTHIKDMAEVEVRSLAADRAARVVAIGVVAVVAAVSIAYFLGVRHSCE